MAFDVKIGNRTYELARARDVLRAPWDVEGARRQLERIEGWTEATARAVLESVDRMPLLRRADDDLTELVARLCPNATGAELKRIKTGGGSRALVIVHGVEQASTGPAPGGTGE